MDFTTYLFKKQWTLFDIIIILIASGIYQSGQQIKFLVFLFCGIFISYGINKKLKL
jgi:hypothetical protein